MPALIRRSNGIYYQVTYFHGRRIWRSTGQHRRREAEKALVTLGQNQKEKTPPELSLSQFVTQFLPYAETNLARTTVLLYKGAIKNFLRHLGNRNLKAYTSLDVEKFKTARVKEVSPVKTNIEFRNMKALFQVGMKWGLIDKNPFAGVKQIRVPPQRPSFFTREEFFKLVGVIPHQWFKDMVFFAVSTMMRAGEVVHLTWDSVDLNRRVIHVENTMEFRVKTTQPRGVPMNDWVYSYLAGKVNRTGRVFGFPDGRNLNVHYFSQKFKSYVVKAGLPKKYHLHTLRHTGASWLVQDGVSIYAVQRLLGHSNIQVTMGYSHLVSSEMHGIVNKIAVTTN